MIQEAAVACARLNAAIGRMMLDYRNPLCTDLSGSVQRIKQIYAAAAEHSLIYAIDEQSISKSVMHDLSKESMMADPVKFIQLLDVFPTVVRYFTVGMAREMGDEAYRAWAIAKLKKASFKVNDNPILMINALEDTIKYAIKQNDHEVFTEALKIIEWSFDEITPRVGDIDAFMSSITELLSIYEKRVEIDNKLADLLCEISTHTFADGQAPSMSMNHMEKLHAEGYYETFKVVSERYCPTASYPAHLNWAENKLGKKFAEAVVKGVEDLDGCHISLMQASALSYYKVSHGHQKGYSQIIDKIQNHGPQELQSILIDVMRVQKRYTRAFFELFSALVKVSDNEQLLINTVNEHGWGESLARSMRASSSMRKHILVNEMGL